MKKIIFTAHCILNTSAKVIQYNQEAVQAEEALRKQFMHKIIDNEIQVIQLPCPEFTLYGPRRWGHVSDQFNNVFFREHCRKLLKPILAQLKAYLAEEDWFEILGVVGVDGSPSCGVDYTSTADWYGSFRCRENLEDAVSGCKLIKKSGVFMEVLKEELEKEGLDQRIRITGLFAAEPEKCMDLLGDSHEA